MHLSISSDAHMRSDVVVITGASAGVGRATAREFARRGARLGLIARGHEGLEATREEVERLGGQALVLPGDVADAARVEESARRVEDRFGAIDVWINNAMASVFSPVKEMEADEYRRVADVTYLGVVHGTLAALRRMAPRDRGVIVQVGSALAYRAIPLQSAYCAAKHAVAGFTESLRTELLHDGSRVHVTIVHLPALNTPQFDWVKSRLPRRAQPVPPIFQPEVAARAIVWAARHRRREVWVGGPTVRAILADRLRRSADGRARRPRAPAQPLAAARRRPRRSRALRRPGRRLERAALGDAAPPLAGAGRPGRRGPRRARPRGSSGRESLLTTS
jgi:NAD(P)-dependent dehydrogenase (short-subunit alcohol dehydrogenase family)